MRSIIEDKRGDFTGVLYMLVTVTAVAIFVLIAGYIATQVTPEIMNNIDSTRPEINASLNATINTATNTLSAVWFIVFGGMLFGLLITSWNIPSKPVFVPIFIILLVVAVIVGVAMSDAYSEVYDATEFASISGTQEAIHFIMVNLEYLAVVIGLISLVVTFAKPNDSGGFSGGAPPM